jgi:thiamine-phosphate pyrophosphorylase
VRPLPFQLIVLTDWSLPDCVARVREALRAGPGIAVQHRHPGATDREFYEEGLRLRETCGDAPLFVNGRLDVALALDAHLHLGERSLEVPDVRPRLPGKLISSACHPPLQGPPPASDLLLVSPVFKPHSKADDRVPLGAEGFHAQARATRTPCFALGGVTAARVSQLAPLAGVAVIGEVMHAASPAHAADALLRALR